MKLLVANGPNLNLTGLREPEIYGKDTLATINSEMKAKFPEIGFEFFQTNSEGDLINKIQSVDKDGFDGAILNAGALSHYSVALRDAIASIKRPVVEVHLSQVFAREEFRRKSAISEVCKGTVTGFGKFSYFAAVFALSEILKK
ncbi:MAG TPA: type II 3-dehydroquinate dehydratase [Candidatus Acidoferrales bacterium]|nr:type II 3-dehydroquinate dehydratase [Candidatus Acidoferrales bacterium]